MNPKPDSIQEYFSRFSPEIQAKLQQMRDILSQALPEAEEVVSYHMPAFKTTEVLVYYAAAKNHLGYYPTSSGVINFKEELSGYATSKGAIQFSYDRELPVPLIAEIAQFRAQEAVERAAARKKRKLR
jgi:uncharacterized protein YdhG (YjbR/CyaY superfamily)